MGYPIITDEYNTMAEGVFLYGGSTMSDTFQSLSNTGYYGWGFAVFSGWAFRAFKSMEAVYHVYLIINSVLIGLIPVFAYEIASKFFSVTGTGAVLISVCVGLYPAYTFYSKYAMNEVPLFLLAWLLLYLLLDFYQASERKRTAYSILLGLFGAYAYTVHGRGLALLGMATLCFVLLLLVVKGSWRRKVIDLVLFGAVALLVNRGNAIIRSYIATGFVGQDVSELSNTTEQFLSPAFFKTLFGTNSFRILYGFSGLGYYIVAATLGMAPIAVVIYLGLAWKCLKARDCDIWALMGTYVVGLMASSVLISVLFFSNLYISEAMPRAEYYLYGRYIEMSGGPLVFFVLLFFCKRAEKAPKERLTAWSLPLYSFLMVCAAVLAFRKILHAANPSLSYTMVPGIVPFAGSSLYTHPTAGSYITLFAVCLVIFLVVLALGRRSYTKALCVFCAGLFLYSTAYSAQEFLYPTSIGKKEQMQPLIDLDQDISSLDGCSLDTVYVLDSTIPKPRDMFAFSSFPVVYMENVKYTYADYGETKENSIFVSTKDEHLDYIFDEIYSVNFGSESTKGGFFIWGRGDVLREQLEQLGYPCEKRGSRIRVLDGADLTLRSNLMSAEEKENLVSLQNKSDSLYLQPGDGNFGPYTALCAGRYQIDISGQNLTAGTYWAYYNLGTVELALEDMTSTDDHIRYCITMPEFFNDVEFCSINFSDSYMMIDRLIVTPLEAESQTSLSDAGNTYFRHRFYSVADAYRNFRSYLQVGDNSVLSTTYVRLHSDGELTVQDMPLAPGQNRLTLQGTNIQFADVTVVSSDGSVLPVALGQETDSCTFDVENADAVTITIQNHSGAAIDFSGLDIRWMGSYE